MCRHDKDIYLVIRLSVLRLTNIFIKNIEKRRKPVLFLGQVANIVLFTPATVLTGRYHACRIIHNIIAGSIIV